MVTLISITGLGILHGVRLGGLEADHGGPEQEDEQPAQCEVSSPLRTNRSLDLAAGEENFGVLCVVGQLAVLCLYQRIQHRDRRLLGQVVVLEQVELPHKGQKLLRGNLADLLGVASLLEGTAKVGLVYVAYYRIYTVEHDLDVLFVHKLLEGLFFRLASALRAQLPLVQRHQVIRQYHAEGFGTILSEDVCVSHLGQLDERAEEGLEGHPSAAGCGGEGELCLGSGDPRVVDYLAVLQQLYELSHLHVNGAGLVGDLGVAPK